jgi:DNA-binding GntR family transcriptional regulator
VTVDPTNPELLSVQLANAIRARIADGTYAWRIPSIDHLSQQYGVSRRTVQRALATLSDEGKIIAVVGRGTFVNRPD